MNDFGAIIGILATLILVTPATAQETEHQEEFVPFDASAPKIEYNVPELITFDIFNPKSLQIEKRRAEPWELAPPLGMEIYVFNMGQADSMLVVGPAPFRKTLLVDLGDARKTPFEGSFSARHVGQRILDITGKRHIDYFVLSHKHQDHFGNGNTGIFELIGRNEFTIGTVIDTGDIGSRFVSSSRTAKSYDELTSQWVEDGKIGKRLKPEFGTGQVDLGEGTVIDILSFGGKYAPDRPSVHEAYERDNPRFFQRKKMSQNDLSIALEISYGDFEFWTGGDLSGASGDGTDAISGSSKSYTNVEFPMVRYWERQGREADVEIFRANHHGSRYSNIPQLLEALDPEFVIYSANRGHKHPGLPIVQNWSKTAFQLATGLDSRVWRRNNFDDYNGASVGEIRIFVGLDGDTYTINGQEFSAYSDQQEAAGEDSEIPSFER